MTETKIYVGLNDAVTKNQLFSTEKYVKILKNVCFAYGTPFSFALEEGGYIHENGEYTKENTLVLTLSLICRRKLWIRSPKRCVFSSIRSPSLSPKAKSRPISYRSRSEESDCLLFSFCGQVFASTKDENCTIM